MILVVDMERHIDMCTADISHLAEMMEYALPGIFPDEDSPVSHSCGGKGTDVEKHTFREEIERGTTIPHLLEHVVLHLLSRRTNHCSAYCGQRSTDFEQGIHTHYYLVMDYPSKVEAIVAADLGFQLVSSWIEGRAATIDPDVVMSGVCEMIRPMIERAA